jgi:hypothetical protein
MAVTRRDFLGATLAFTAQPSFGAEQSGDWYDRPMRWAQVAFTEDDPGNYDPQMWFDFFKRIHADAACLSAGGIVAFYPTKVPLHYRSKYLGNRDAFGEMVTGCRKLGMNVIARTDPHACRDDVFRKHPDWIAREANGNPRRHWANPELYVTCALGPYNFEFMTEVTKEIVQLYKVDGVFSNRWAGHGQCWCEHCRKNFKDFSGLDLPTSDDPGDPARRQYIVWEQKRLFDCWRVWDNAIRAINPNASFIANSGGGALSELDMKTVGELSHTLFADRQARRGVMAPWANGKNGKEYRATMGSKPIGGIFSVGVEEPYRWKDSVQSEAEIRIWVADGIAQGLRPWFTKFNAKPYDKRWMPVVEDIYGWHYRNEKYLRNEQSLARVAMVYSQQTAAYYGGPQARTKVEDPSLGFYQALVESRVPFEMVHDHLLAADQLHNYKVLILPNIAALSEGQCEQLDAYVRRGGSIVATYETSLCDEWGKRRPDFGLSKLFACSFGGKVEERQQNAYLTVERGPNGGTLHPLLAGLENTPRIISAVGRVHVKPHNTGTRAPLTLIPSYPDLPMEDVFPRVPNTDIPMVFATEHGAGRVVYFPMDIDRTFWEVLNGDHLQLLRNAVHWALNEPARLIVTGKGLLDVALWKQKSSLTAHLVNLTNPMTMKGPFRETFPVGPLTVDIQLPSNVRAAGARLLTAGQRVQMSNQQGRVRVQIPTVDVHEVVAIDLA